MRGDNLLLLVEDDPETRNALETILELEGFQTIPTSSVEEALQKFYDHSEMLSGILSDTNLGGRRGEEIHLAVAPELARRNIPFIAMSGYWGGNLQSSAYYAQHGVPCLPKPVELDRLLRLLRG